MTRYITTAIILITTGGLIAWDIFVAIEPTPHDTISEVVLSYLRRHPFIPLAMGVLVGHLSWPWSAASSFKLWLVLGLCAAGVAFLVLDIIRLLPGQWPIVYVLAGILLGHFLWPQTWC